jgi:hypothetical protein
MQPSYRSPQELVEGLHACQREARRQLWELLREPVRQLMTRLVDQHALDEDPDLLTRHALHAAEAGLRTRPPANLAELSWTAFRGALLLQIAKTALQPFGETHPGAGGGPPPLPESPEYESVTFFRPSARLGGRLFGGDWYAGRRLVDGSLWVFVADVTGHGYFAYLLASSLPAVWHQCWAAHPNHPPTPAELLGAMHRLLAECMPEGIYLECTLARLGPDGQTVVLPAGGTRMLVRSGTSRPQLLKLRGCWLGLRAPSHEEEHALALGPGDEILLATDGVFDQLDEAGGAEAVTATAVPGRATLFGLVSELLERSLARGPQKDDITMILLRRRWPGHPGPGGPTTNGAGDVSV